MCMAWKLLNIGGGKIGFCEHMGGHCRPSNILEELAPAPPSIPMPMKEDDEIWYKCIKNTLLHQLFPESHSVFVQSLCKHVNNSN